MSNMRFHDEFTPGYPKPAGGGCGWLPSETTQDAEQTVLALLGEFAQSATDLLSQSEDADARAQALRVLTLVSLAQQQAQEIARLRSQNNARPDSMSRDLTDGDWRYCDVRGETWRLRRRDDPSCPFVIELEQRADAIARLKEQT